MLPRTIAIGGVAAATAALAWVLFVGLPRWYPAERAPVSGAVSGATGSAKPRHRGGSAGR